MIESLPWTRFYYLHPSLFMQPYHCVLLINFSLILYGFSPIQPYRINGTEDLSEIAISHANNTIVYLRDLAENKNLTENKILKNKYFVFFPMQDLISLLCQPFRPIEKIHSEKNSSSFCISSLEIILLFLFINSAKFHEHQWECI